MSDEIPREVLDRWPPDLRLSGAEVVALLAEDPAATGDPDLRTALSAGADALRAVFAARRQIWPLEGYDVLVSWHDAHGLVDISFCPAAALGDDGLPVFEIADRGLYANGPGVRFFLWADDLSVVDRVFMR